MILTLIKKINNIINDILNILQNSNIYINNNYEEFVDILSNDEINIYNIISLSEYIYIINNYIYNIIINEKKNFNTNIKDKINEINIHVNDIIKIINENLIINDICAYIKNSNNNEFLHILYLIFLLKNKNKCIIDTITEKMNENNVYLRNMNVYNYDSLIFNEYNNINKNGLTSEFIKQTQYINNDAEYTEKNKNIKIINDNLLRHNKFINEFVNNYYDTIELKDKEYNNFGALIDYGKSVEIQLYNDYTRRHAYNKGTMNKTEISVFELFNL